MRDRSKGHQSPSVKGIEVNLDGNRVSFSSDGGGGRDTHTHIYFPPEMYPFSTELSQSLYYSTSTLTMFTCKSPSKTFSHLFNHKPFLFLTWKIYYPQHVTSPSLFLSISHSGPKSHVLERRATPSSGRNKELQVCGGWMRES